MERSTTSLKTFLVSATDWIPSQKHQINARPYSTVPEKRAETKHLWALGVSVLSIADAVERVPGTIYKWINDTEGELEASTIEGRDPAFVKLSGERQCLNSVHSYDRLTSFLR